MTQAETEDAEANLFAMELLMPEQFVRKEVSKIKGFDILEDNHMKQLANKFKVPTSIMAIRFGQIYNIENVLRRNE
jgi:Zn-dependent peptidase ImmA (M78 family)